MFYLIAVESMDLPISVIGAALRPGHRPLSLTVVSGGESKVFQPRLGVHFGGRAAYTAHAAHRHRRPDSAVLVKGNSLVYQQRPVQYGRRR